MTITVLFQRFIRVAIAAVTLAATATAVSAQQEVTLEVVASFEGPTRNGANPAAPLLQASDGKFYGTTSRGGTFGVGTIFSITGSGEFTVLHHFTGGDDGNLPVARLIQGSDGSLYGTTRSGGASNVGTVFRFDPDGTLTTLHSFNQQEGGNPETGLVQAADGRFYGTTTSFSGGTIFRIDAAGAFTTLHGFTDGLRPHVELVQAGDGSLYGATLGTIYKADLEGNVTTVHTFDVGQGVAGPLVKSTDGNLYGVTYWAWGFCAPPTPPPGGCQPPAPANQLFFRVDASGAFSVVQGLPGGFEPRGGLVEANDGSFYGTAGSAISPGQMFRIDRSGGLTTLHALNTDDGTKPTGLIQAVDGSFYSTTASASSTAASVGGAVFKIDVAAGPTTVRVFGFDSAGGANPATGVIQGTDGRLYGTASNGGAVNRGTVFTLDTTGIRALHSFDIADTHPEAGLVQAGDGNFYGTTVGSAVAFLNSPHAGTVFKVDSAGAFVRLATFATNSSQPKEPRGALIDGGDGFLYGTSSEGGSNSIGTIFRVTATGTVTVFHGFSAFGAAGLNPYTGIVKGPDGNFYGTTSRASIGSEGEGVAYRITPTGTVTALHTFTGPDGAWSWPANVGAFAPARSLTASSDGRLYGTTPYGGIGYGGVSGASGNGTVFVMDLSGALTTLHYFDGADGAQPLGAVLQASDGNFYGTTCGGGAVSLGTVFRIDATGQFTTLHSFSGPDGRCPSGVLIQAGDGHLYGTTQRGGQDGAGVLFRVRLATSPAEQYYEIVSRNSGKCLDVYGASTDAVAPIIQWICHGGPNQQWRLESAGGGAFRIIARHSGQALNVYGAFLDDSTPLIQYPVSGTDNEAWTLEPAGDGYVQVVARHSGKAMDVEFASTDDGARVIQFTPHGGPNQQWLLRAVGSTAAPATAISAR